MKQSTDFLTDTEKSKVEAFVEDQTAMSALKKVLLDFIYNQGIQEPGEASNLTRNWVYSFTQNQDISDEEMGRKIRTMSEAMGIVEKAFNDLAKLKVVKEKEDKKNPAR